jgi:hypothetical protein
MRAAPGPVKLQFDNVRRHPVVPVGRMDPAKRTISPPKNIGNIDIFEQIGPLRPIRARLSDQIDENGSLPYKPRQLSAMARFDRGGSIWAEKGSIGSASITGRNLINQANCLIGQIVALAGRLSAENDP